MIDQFSRNEGGRWYQPAYPSRSELIKTPKRSLTGANRGNGENISVLSVSSCSIPGVNIYSRRDGDADFKFLARDSSTTYVDNRLFLVFFTEAA